VAAICVANLRGLLTTFEIHYLRFVDRDGDEA